MNRSYIKLAVKFALVLAAVILVSKVNESDGRAVAGEYAAIVSSETKLGEFTRAVNEINRQKAPDTVVQVADAQGAADLADGTEGCDSNGEEYIPENDVPASAVVAGNDPEETKEYTDIPAEDSPSADNNAADGGDAAGIPGGDDSGEDTDDAGENEDGTDVTVSASNGEDDPDVEGGPYAGMSELEAATLRAARDESFRKTQEYIDALLVTSPAHYNADIVLEATSIPLESNDARYEFLTGKGYKAYRIDDLPEGYTSDNEAATRMVTFDVPVWKMTKDGTKYSSTWEITVNSKLAASVRCIFSDIYLLDIKFPFNYLKGYMFRKVGGSGLMNSKLLSIHSFGAAIDINFWDNDNDYYLGKGNDLRNKDNPYCIPPEVIDVFASYGWNWGGNFDICVDSMHFQYFGLEFLQYDNDEPFPILSIDRTGMKEIYIRNLTQRLVRLGYLEAEDGTFTEEVDEALRAFQTDHDLEPDGIADYETWVPLINATHDMSYVF